MTSTPLFSADAALHQLIIPVSLFKNINDSGAVRPFAEKGKLRPGEKNPPKNALFVTPEQEGQDFPSNASFEYNGHLVWSQFVALFTVMATAQYKAKEDAILFSPTVYETKLQWNGDGSPHRGFRCKPNATTSALVPIDADNKVGPVLHMDEAIDRLRDEKVEAIIYSTASNQTGDRFRIVIPLAEQVDPDTQQRAVKAVCRALKVGWKSDASKNNCYSLFYTPGRYLGASNQFEHLHGEIRTAQQWVELYPDTEATTNERIRQIERVHIKENDVNTFRPMGGEWDAEKDAGHLLDDYRGLRSDRHKSLYALGTKLAMSAINHGYQIDASELCDILDREQRSNTPKSPYTDNELQRVAREGVTNARKQAGDDPAYLRPRIKSWAEQELEHDLVAFPEAPDDFADDPDGVADYEQREEEQEPDKQNTASGFEQNDVVVSAWSSSDPVFDLFGNLTPEPVLHRDMLPKVIADYVYEQAAMLGCNPGPMAMAALVLCAALISDNVLIMPKRYEDYYESPRLWLILAGDVSSRKTPMLKKLLKPVKRVANRLRNEDRRAMDAYKRAVEVWECKRNAWTRATAKGADDVSDFAPEKPEKPPRRRLITNDFTVESLAAVLAENPRGILIELDEIMQLFGGFDAYKQAGTKKDRSVILQLYNGGPREVDRVRTQDEPVYVPNWGASQIGGIQHERLRQFGPKLVDDGLLQRFWLIPMEATGDELDRCFDPDIERNYEMLIESLVGFDPKQEHGVIIKLSDPAHEYRQRMQELIRAFETLPAINDGLRTHAGKMGSMFARLMLTLHIVENTPFLNLAGDKFFTVTGDTAKRAYDLMVKYLIPHAVRQYEQIFESNDADEAQKDLRWLAGHILARNLEKLDKRACHDANRAFKRDPNRAAKALKALREANWIDAADTVNPLVHQLFAERATQERKDRDTKLKRLRKAQKVVGDTWGQGKKYIT